MPERIQLRRAKGWRMPPLTVKVDRTSKWGNPFSVWHDENDGQWFVSDGSCHWPVANKADGLALAVEKYTEQMEKRYNVAVYGAATDLLDLQGELAGKNLACWCAPGRPCHADVLLRFANAQPLSQEDRHG